MFRLQARDEFVVRWKKPETLDLVRKAFAFNQMAGGMPVSLISTLVERERDHGPKEFGRCQRMGVCKTLRCRRQDEIKIAVPFAIVPQDEIGRLAEVLPAQEEG